MLKIKEIIQKAELYAVEKYGERVVLSDAIFRKEKGKYYLGFMIYDFVDEKNNDFRIKRPTKWMLLDILSGDLIDHYDANDYDYSNQDDLPFNLKVSSQGSPELYKYYNQVMKSFQGWKRQVLVELEQSEKENNFKSLKVDEDFISPRDYIISNIEPYLLEMFDKLKGLGDVVQQAFEESYNYVIEEVRNHYRETNEINQEKLKNYLELIKYLWNDQIEFINAFDNVSN